MKRRNIHEGIVEDEDDYLKTEIPDNSGDETDSGEEDESSVEEDAGSDEGDSVEEETEEDYLDSEHEEREGSDESVTGDENPKENIYVSSQSLEGGKSEASSSGIGDEYEYDSSDEEDIRNTVGNIPLKWYDEYSHVGYDLEGKPIAKPQRGDQLDRFLKKMEDPDSWRTVIDPSTGAEMKLSDEDVQLLERLTENRVPDGGVNDTEPWNYWFSSQDVMQTPIVNVPPHKRSFLPSKDEAKRVAKLIHMMKMGALKPLSMVKPKVEGPQFYMLWDSDDKAEDIKRIESHIAAPKMRLPGHAESYNPPPEYLFTEKELETWKSLEEEPWKRKYQFIPQKYSNLRSVPGYGSFVKERFERCMDLYLAPRARKNRLMIQPEDLIPQLPKPKDLQPFPTVCTIIFKGHTGYVRSIGTDPKGQFLLSGSDDGLVKVWEVSTGRCLKTFEIGTPVRSVAWCPNNALSLVAVAAGHKVFLLNPGVGDKLVVANTDQILKEEPDQGDYVAPPKIKTAVTWEVPEHQYWDKGIRIIITHFKEVKQVTWHPRGDYFSSVMPEGANRSVVIHQLSKRRSQVPLSRPKGIVQCVLFHPIRPYFFVATQRYVKIYNLAKQELSKKLMTGARWISSIAVHPGGDNVLVGTYDRKLQWFDLDLSSQAYQTLRHHSKGIRCVAYHRRYPLFVSGSDDGSAIVCHGMVYNDLLQNPLIVPVKILRGHEKVDDFGLFDVLFHPHQPWLFTSGADATIRLFS
ncbi:ribosome biogenesis protein BOP1 homolog [Artemia franciscana]|uniref:Ribosome biogenesis protein BOP1 homolog n=1 Tax=Artemia franciscana TaxID=6661 RepID=A0AA88LB11_ARTSF|nr:hypothetical protein QYM36_002193 [Artemia franciscana]KAK2723762.1 hypothetical protein QYM36_002193 [Artemia franciscana]KAK2723763.1 hypothetical protein QYM36_002193 [Artemia franciscana]